MRKKFLSMVMVCITAILLLSVTASAYYLTGKCGDNVEWGLDLYDFQIDIWGSGDMQNFNSSSSTAMSDRWGGVPSKIKKVDIDEGVTSIGNYAFAFCSTLSDVKLPSSLTTIGEGAFNFCENLEEIELPEGTKEIGAGAFLKSGLKDITIPSTLTKIGVSAFDTSGHLNIHISDINAWCNIETSAGFFHGEETTDLYIESEPATNVIIPNGTKRINYHAFYDFSNVKSVTIPKSVTYIDVYAFSKNTTLNVYENSYAHKYAVENSIPYKFISYPNTTGNSITISNSQKSDDTISLTAELSSSEEIQGTIFAAVYDTNGALTNIESYSAATSNDISITKKDNAYTAKIFWWFDADGMYPMAHCEEIKLNEVETVYSITKDYDNTRGSVTVTENGKEITTAAEGKQITIEVSPNSGYGVLLIEVTDVNGNIIEITNNTFTMPKGDVNVTVTFVGTKDSGNFGINNNLTWLLDDNGTLTISGSGQMEDFTSSTAPWSKYNEDIKIVVIKDGVTRISKNAFADCSKIKRVLIDKSVTEIEAAAFKNCSDLSTVEYSRSQSDWEEIYIGTENEPLKNANFIYNSALSDTAQTDLDYLKFTKNEDNTITITNCLADAVKINIPKEIGGLPVTTIGENTFSDCGSLTSVTIPNSVTSIGDYAFSGCPLTNVIIPDSVTSIGIGIFSGCSSLASITIPDNVTAIGNFAFYNCKCLINITISNNVTTIGEHAFSGCGGLTSVTVPDSVTSIGEYAFNNCNSLENVYISDMTAWCNIEFDDTLSNPMYYADNLYLNNELLTNLLIPDSVTSISDYAFYNCSNLTSITIPDSVTSIGWGAFEKCSGLTSITIPDSVTSIGKAAFENCSGLTSVTIGNGVTSIGSYAFYFCSSLTSVTIPDSITKVDIYAFQHCSNLDSVYISDIAAYLNIEFGSVDSNPMYYANKLYLNNKRIVSLDIPEGVTKIPAYAFSGCDSLIRVKIPDTVTSIGRYAFYDCNSLEEITIPFIGKEKNVSEYEEKVFGYIFGDTRYFAFGGQQTQPEGTTLQYSSGDWRYCYYIPESVKRVIITNTDEIPFYAFNNCIFLESVTIPDSVTSIGSYAFNNCRDLATVYYTGREEDWGKISISSNNYGLTRAEKVYNYVPEE